MEKTQYDFQILINLDQEVADLWVGHCLNIDVVSQGATPCAALENTMMATQFLVLDDCANGKDPHSRNIAPKEDWDAFRSIQKAGKTVKTKIILDKGITIQYEATNIDLLNNAGRCKGCGGPDTMENGCSHTGWCCICAASEAIKKAEKKKNSPPTPS